MKQHGAVLSDASDTAPVQFTSYHAKYFAYELRGGMSYVFASGGRTVERR